ncbi:MAG TPA: LD-carboxypeptidase [Candidatus Marinimicrobia bacterium]|jgi:muramoyltetrapeptide carboxypeptidase|nr:LD-carboxypeptidase [Candidatus Neomarinimicrobiota bacterium]
MIRPAGLRSGANIGVISPSYWIADDVLKNTAEIFTSRNFHLTYGESIKLKEGPFAGPPELRADDLNNMFADPNIDAIFCARGGYGANRVLPLLNYDLIKENPKIFIGNSDITAYLTSITQKTEIITFHGPMLVSYKHGFIEYNFDQMMKVLTSTKNIVINPPAEFDPHILKKGTAKGPLWGGNLSLVMNRLGTDGQINTTGCILFLEDLDEYLYSFERMLVHLQTAGVFNNINGLIIGELIDIKDQEISFGKSTDDIIMEICGTMDIPIVTNFPCGHGKYQATLPISLPIELCADETVKLKFLGPAVN